MCLTNKKKPPNKTKTKQETNFSFQRRVSFTAGTYLSCVLERLGWEVKCFFVRAPRLSAESACWMCACICAVAQIFLERAHGFCTLCNSPGKISPAHPLTRSASGRGFAPPSSPFTRSKTHNYDSMSWFLLSLQRPPDTPAILWLFLLTPWLVGREGSHTPDLIDAVLFSFVQTRCIACHGVKDTVSKCSCKQWKDWMWTRWRCSLFCCQHLSRCFFLSQT